MRPILRLTALSIGYNGVRGKKVMIAKDISLDLPEGEFVCLLGPNGAGKSTLIRTISGMQKPLAGEILLDDSRLYQIPSAALAKKLSVVLTERTEVGLLTAYEVVSLGRYPYTNWTGKLLERDHEVVHNCIRITGSVELASRPFNELSDGERQRIIMARALAQEPKLLVLDEITAFLDLPRRVEIMHLLRNLTRTTGCSVILSTHDLELALSTADQVWLLPKEGSLLVGTPEDLVLNGSFESAFSSEGLLFDVDSGRFRMKSKLAHPVQLIGEGTSYIWTKRALERFGLEVSQEAQKIFVSIVPDKEVKGCRWEVFCNGDIISCYNIRQLLDNVSRITV